MTPYPRRHWCPTLRHKAAPGSNPGSGISVLPANEPVPEFGGCQPDSKSKKRAPGTGQLRIKHNAWYGSWRTVDGVRTLRKLGLLSELTREEADAKLRQLVASRASYRKRAERPRHDENAGVYFIVGADKVKIGRTERTPVALRLERIQRWSPVPLELHRFVALAFPDAVERELHRRFVAEHSHGEWFDLSVLTIIDGWSDEDLAALPARPEISRQPAARTTGGMMAVGDTLAGRGIALTRLLLAEYMEFPAPVRDSCLADTEFVAAIAESDVTRRLDEWLDRRGLELSTKLADAMVT